jgi:hypothetical protein
VYEQPVEPAQPPPAAQTLMAELCFAEPPALSAPAILDAVRLARPDADLTEADGNLLITYGLLRNMYPDARSAPLLSAITRPIPDTEPRDLTHSRGWSDAAEVLGRCRYSLLITEFLGRDVDPGSRVAAYHAAVQAVVATTAPLATWWPGSQQAVPPGELAGDPLRGLVNVRTFEDPDDPDVAVMDTLGMTQFGLADLQCHFRYLDQDLMTGLLRNGARFLFEGGALDGAVRGFTQHQRWPVRPEAPFAGPERPTLSIDPGAPFAAATPATE